MGHCPLLWTSAAASSRPADMQSQTLQCNHPNNVKFHKDFQIQEFKKHEVTEMCINQIHVCTQAIAAMDSYRVGQPDHAKSEDLPGGHNRAAKVMLLELQVQTTQGAVQFQSWQEQTGRQRAPCKVWLWPDLIQLAPRYIMQPTWISSQNHTGLQGQPPY